MNKKQPKQLLQITGLAIALALSSTLTLPRPARGEETAFTYQGKLNDNSGPANGLYDFTFTVYDLPTGNGSFAIQTNLATVVTNGLFTVTLDFGPVVSEAIFSGPPRWLEINVRTNGTGGYAALTPRQRLTATPYAITAANVISNGLAAGIYSNPVTFNNPANIFAGNGAGLANVNAQSLGGLGTNGFWRTTGNAGTTAGPNFLGTADNQPLELQVNSTRALRLEPHATSAPSLVGGYFQNSANGFLGAVIGGGGTSASPNNVSGNYGFVGAGHGALAGNFSAVVGGAYNNSSAAFSFVGAGLSNTNLADYSFVGGGTNNTIQVSSDGSTIAGGSINQIGIGAGWATIGGGQYNNNAGAWATIAGGYNNNIQSNAIDALIAGGHDNIIEPTASFAMIGAGGYHVIGANSYDALIGAGGYNIIQPNSQGSVIVGGYSNTNGGYGSAIVGGYNNAIGSNAFASFIGGGRGNLIDVGAFDSTIGGGPYNWILSNANASTIGGGYLNVIQNNASGSIVGGGVDNIIEFNAGGSAIFGGYYNFIQPNAFASFIGGGTNNTIATPRSVIGGGESNYVAGDYATIAGGGYNQASGRASFIGGGGGRDSGGGGPYPNTASGDWSVIGGGWNNIASGYSSVVGGGAVNTNTGFEATIGGGGGNRATNNYATVPGGAYNVAGGSYSFAAGLGALALHSGAFVWADSQNVPFASTGNDQFLIRAAGGVGINKNNPATALDVNGTITASAFSGSGGNLLGLNASQLTSGTLPDARLSANVATLNGAQTFTGAKTFSAPTTFNGFVGVGTSSSIGAGSFVVSQNTAGFAGMYVNSGASGKPFYGYSQNGSVPAYSYVDGSDANKWKLFMNGAGDSIAVTTSGSVGVGTNNPQSLLHVNGESRWGRANILSTNQSGSIELGDSSQSGTTPFIDFHYGVVGSQDYSARIINDAPAQLSFFSMVSSTPMARLNNSGLTVNGTFVSSSDRNLKENFEQVDSRAVLEKVAAMPVSTWNYKSDPTSRHLGPMAQDFYAAFAVGPDDKHITTVDESGVALAAIQGLNEKVEEKEAEIQSLKQRNQSLEQRLNQLESLMKQFTNQK